MAAQDETNTAGRARKTRQTAGNQVISDEVFMATNHDRHMPDAVDRLYLKVKDNRWHFKKSPDDLAFIDKGNKLETPSDSHMVAETLVRVAERRGWDEIRVTGSETFRREVWYEAARRSISVRGHTPTEVDKARLAELMPQRHQTPAETDRSIERARSYLNDPAAKALEKAPELAGAFAAREAIKTHLASTTLTEQERAIVMQRVDKRMQADLRRGHLPTIYKQEYVQEARERVLKSRKTEPETGQELER